MELQWPLILFTTFVAWSAGLFGAQGAAALAGEGRRAQLPALVCSAALLAVGGIAVFFHLEHFERIFNGFGNPTSGITQELVCVVVVAALMVVACSRCCGRRMAATPTRPALPRSGSRCSPSRRRAVLVLVTGHPYTDGRAPCVGHACSAR
ncbi:MAG: hypothetical protein ACLTDR_04505 [Adlercreutzia equolifaciens]